MAQLIKLENYISRYERDIYHYPGHYIRLKQENWTKLHQYWQEHRTYEIDEKNDELNAPTNYSRWKSFFNKREEIEDMEDRSDKFIPNTLDELKKYYLDSLLPFQLKWATSTVDKMSFFDKAYQRNELLKFFLQRLPDTFLVMFMPIFKIKKSIVEADIIIVHPVGIDIVKVVNLAPHKALIVEDSRTWYTEENNIQTKLLSPLISVNRTEKIVQSILASHDLDFPIKKVLLSFDNTIEFRTEPYNTEIVDQTNIEGWVKQKQKFVSPLKRDQLKAAESILHQCDTVSVSRPEWNQDSESDWE